jgi:hypothetical protein
MAGQSSSAGPVPLAVPRPVVKSRRRVWLSAAALLVVLGATGSILGAAAVVRDGAQQSHQRFTTESAPTASTLKLVIAQESDLAVDAEALIGANPGITNTASLNWINAINTKTRFPEVTALGFSDVVRRAQLSYTNGGGTLLPPGYDICPADDPTQLAQAFAAESRVPYKLRAGPALAPLRQPAP